jgi:hypothetical protein
VDRPGLDKRATGYELAMKELMTSYGEDAGKQERKRE